MDFEPYTEEMHKENVQAEQKGMSYEEVAELMSKRNDFILEMDNLPPQNHIWTDRGLKYTCENAGHTYHEAWKIRPMQEA